MKTLIILSMVYVFIAANLDADAEKVKACALKELRDLFQTGPVSFIPHEKGDEFYDTKCETDPKVHSYYTLVLYILRMRILLKRKLEGHYFESALQTALSPGAMSFDVTNKSKSVNQVYQNGLLRFDQMTCSMVERFKSMVMDMYMSLAQNENSLLIEICGIYKYDYPFKTDSFDIYFMLTYSHIPRDIVMDSTFYLSGNGSGDDTNFTKYMNGALQISASNYNHYMGIIKRDVALLTRHKANDYKLQLTFYDINNQIQKECTLPGFQATSSTGRHYCIYINITHYLNMRSISFGSYDNKFLKFIAQEVFKPSSA